MKSLASEEELCVYPTGEKGCLKPAYGKIHNLPLCKEHWDLTQWIGYIILKNEEKRADEIGPYIKKVEEIIDKWSKS